MIAMPEAWHVAENAGQLAFGNQRLRQRRRKGRAPYRENSPRRIRTGVPAISQWPDGVSLPREVSTP